ncbi:hypothetical protein EVAR_92880_1 [Eumeta japonica]|uniref:Uncharacterized protein n=1 Tax=Eumeta variegata TaxID=151549 RepID=A0A4C1TD84_EUMVA|nr:hypothetical protein EVAR_92880_1 [Eumeta japonica]
MLFYFDGCEGSSVDSQKLTLGSPVQSRCVEEERTTKRNDGQSSALISLRTKVHFEVNRCTVGDRCKCHSTNRHAGQADAPRRLVNSFHIPDTAGTV